MTPPIGSPPCGINLGVGFRQQREGDGERDGEIGGRDRIYTCPQTQSGQNLFSDLSFGEIYSLAIEPDRQREESLGCIERPDWKYVCVFG